VSTVEQTLSTADRLEIEELYARACRCLDFPDPDGFTALFTVDGSFGIRKTDGEFAYRHVGHEALHAFVSKMAEVRAGRTRHWLNNIILEPDGDDARGMAYQMMVKNTIEPPSIEIIITGTCEDVIARTEGGWRFRERVVVADR
jgi:hypothetical protein